MELSYLSTFDEHDRLMEDPPTSNISTNATTARSFIIALSTVTILLYTEVIVHGKVKVKSHA
jgi:hypothetical protein